MTESQKPGDNTPLPVLIALLVFGIICMAIGTGFGWFIYRTATEHAARAAGN